MANIFKKIIIPSRPHPDVIVGIFLLIEFGQEKYPGVKDALIDIRQHLPAGETKESLEKEGALLLDIGGGKLDHHKSGKNLSHLIADDLGVSADPSLARILTYAERDDKYGAGTISKDSLDRAFGLSGLISVLNKTVEDPTEVVRIVLPLLEAHVHEEKVRTQELPQEFEKKLKNGGAEIFNVDQGKKNLKVVVLESDSVSMACWLKSSAGLKADVVCQRLSSGFTNILTKQQKGIDLKWTAAYLRKSEADLRGTKLKCSTLDLMAPGKLAQVPEWYYDKATNSLLNGGVNPKGLAPTTIPLETIRDILKESLTQDPPK